MAIKVQQTGFSGLVVIEPDVFGDNRGYFCETLNLSWQGVDFPHFVQDNESLSQYGVVRGLHFQKGEWAQAKLVGVGLGEVLDVVVDLRPGEPTFGKQYSIKLSDQNHKRLLIPRGFAHGFAVLSPKALFQYKCDNYYNPSAEDGIAWDDSALAIDWGLPAEDIILSQKDRNHQTLKEYIISNGIGE